VSDPALVSPAAQAAAAAASIADFVRARADDDNRAVVSAEGEVTYREWVQACADRAALWQNYCDPARPPHIGVLLENTIEFTMWLGAAALAGATVVGINPTRRGAELQRDITHTDCQMIVTDSAQHHLFDGLDLGMSAASVHNIDSPAYSAAVATLGGAALPDVAVASSTQYLLLFTSGTSGHPKAVICSHGRLVGVANAILGIAALTPADTTYISMPLFHSNALFSAWAPSVAAGATVALRRKFSASEFLPDIRRFRATYFNYVGKPLAYVLATPPQPDDREHTLRLGFGNEANEADLAGFTARFGCPLIDGYGQTETGASISRVPGMPAGSLGMAAPAVKVLDPETGAECPPAIFGDDGKLLNAAEATGEIVNTGPSGFEGYWNNPEANAERMREGAYWTGDLAYRDAAGFFYFAGRNADWLRVDGENFAAAPIERILARFPGVVLAAVYGVPDPVAGDRVMGAIQLADGTAFDPDALASFLAEQADLGPKWMPHFVRIVSAFPMTETNKVLKRTLVAQRWSQSEGLWVRDGQMYRPFSDEDEQTLRSEFERHGRLGVLV
jgi:fatty-acyl-CoA synthase